MGIFITINGKLSESLHQSGTRRASVLIFSSVFIDILVVMETQLKSSSVFSLCGSLCVEPLISYSGGFTVFIFYFFLSLSLTVALLYGANV